MDGDLLSQTRTSVNHFSEAAATENTDQHISDSAVVDDLRVSIPRWGGNEFDLANLVNF